MYPPRAVAAMIGVSPSTLKTWDQRYGLGPSARTGGGHRRYDEDDVAVLRRMIALTGQGVAPAAAAELARQVPAPRTTPATLSEDVASTARKGFLNAARRLDEPLMSDLAAKLVTEHGVVPSWDSVFVPCLAELGAVVTDSGRGVEVEHLASSSILSTFRAVPRPDKPGVLAALLSCAPEEQHVLALEALGAALSEAGSWWRNLGARVPPEALCDAVERLRPAVVVIWAHSAELASLVPLRELRTGSEALLAVAGPGWAGIAAPSFVRRPGDLAEAVQLVLSRAGT
ncbi:MerR family transcriptional regulator [Lentzea sp. DG1S-22]|uniref:MerR family transcriptional regulator n=1 Tax=Lentzea sp. DG1S-22 TaxID=3108822 RepID=UPI002E7A3324|nr:MerR family transcriptional regulator [Lentzea sp. DG1S-22]WVH83692.1 MerR family transcriptional regulator [Lentzea sp. DG1S-22]